MERRDACAFSVMLATLVTLASPCIGCSRKDGAVGGSAPAPSRATAPASTVDATPSLLAIDDSTPGEAKDPEGPVRVERVHRVGQRYAIRLEHGRPAVEDTLDATASVIETNGSWATLSMSVERIKSADTIVLANARFNGRVDFASDPFRLEVESWGDAGTDSHRVMVEQALGGLCQPPREKHALGETWKAPDAAASEWKLSAVETIRGETFVTFISKHIVKDGEWSSRLRVATSDGFTGSCSVHERRAFHGARPDRDEKWFLRVTRFAAGGR